MNSGLQPYASKTKGGDMKIYDEMERQAAMTFARVIIAVAIVGTIAIYAINW